MSQPDRPDYAPQAVEIVDDNDNNLIGSKFHSKSKLTYSVVSEVDRGSTIN